VRAREQRVSAQSDECNSRGGVLITRVTREGRPGDWRHRIWAELRWKCWGRDQTCLSRARARPRSPVVRPVSPAATTIHVYGFNSHVPGRDCPE
jgi:hypothetical protein